MANDPYKKLIDEQWDDILMMWEMFRDKKPILEYEVTEQKLYSYPADDYIQTLSARTRNQTKQQYAKVLKNNQFMLFVKDSKNRKLRSYIFDLPPDDSKE